LDDFNNPKLKVWQELKIHGTPAGIEDFINTIDTNLPENWKKTDTDLSGKIKRHGYLLKDFGVAGLKFWLWQTKPTECYLQNIVPENPLDNPAWDKKKDIYNSRLQLFREQIIEPLQFNADVNIIFDGDMKTIEELTSPEIGQKLRSFSALANKSTLHSHPLDYQRWSNFVFTVHKSGMQNFLDSDRLEDWLIHAGWRREGASELAREYSSNLAILEKYDSFLLGQRDAD